MKSVFLIICTVLLTSCFSEKTVRSDKPVSRAKAEKALHRVLPASASDVYFLFSADGLQTLQAYTRFRVNPGEADLAIEEMITENNRLMKRSLPYARSLLPPPRLATPLVDSQRRFKPISWWQPQTIKNGYFRGDQLSYALAIWYDADNSLIYVAQTD